MFYIIILLSMPRSAIGHRGFTRKQIDYWRNIGKPNTGKYEGVYEDFELAKRFQGSFLEKNAVFYLDPHDKDAQPRVIIFPDQKEEALKKLYENPQYGFNSLMSFYSHVRQTLVGVSRDDVADFLRRNSTYQQFQAAPNRFAAIRSAITTRPFVQLQIDLIDFQKLAKYNRGHHWLLTCVDLFTKYGFAVPLKNKTADEVSDALEGVLHTIDESFHAIPTTISHDNGPEFKGATTKLLEKNEIKQIFSSPYHPQSQGAIEALNGTIKKMLARYFAHFETKNWVDAINDIMQNYNNRKHSTTKKVPEILAHTNDKKKLKEAKENIISRAESTLSFATSFSDDLEVGDWVRVSLYDPSQNTRENTNKLAKRNMNPTFSAQIFQIERVIRPRAINGMGHKTLNPIKYMLRGLPNFYYRLRLQKTAPPQQQIYKLPATNTLERPDKELERDTPEDEEKKEQKEEQTNENNEPETTGAAQKAKEKKKTQKSKDTKALATQPVRTGGRDRKQVSYRAADLARNVFV